MFTSHSSIEIASRISPLLCDSYKQNESNDSMINDMSKPNPKTADIVLDKLQSFSTTYVKSDLSSDRLIATLMYRTKTSYSSQLSCDTNQSLPPASNSCATPSPILPVSTVSELQSLSSVSSAPALGFSSNASWGPGISYLCINTFQNLVSSLLLNKGSPTLTFCQKFLDKPKDPLIVELISSKFLNHKIQNLSNLSTHELIQKFEADWNVDIIFQVDTVFRRYPRLVCFDMDSTLIQEELIDLIAASIGVEAEVSALTERAMNGELDFLESLKMRVKLLEGIEEDIFIKLRSSITPTRGVKELVRALKRIGVRTAVFSGGFLSTASWLAEELGLDYAHANILSVSNGRLTGELEGDIVNAERKRTLLCEVAKKENIELSQTIAVGDGANDLLMLGAAGLGVAWNAKPFVQRQVQAKLNRESLLDLLYVFGFTAEEISSLVS
ncbi:hypothetical protein EPUL_006550 [Erysiphe pulchra]|uniref:phosphoserine phosphatase n=1 Tax=Erysiphe pulchra TaxID=225359 RepID=A0A2S4PLD5_9PEZI|nr:hypothetical protein EPUL_006550 [Erysiphe pulchra]